MDNEYEYDDDMTTDEEYIEYVDALLVDIDNIASGDDSDTDKITAIRAILRKHFENED